MVGCFCWFFIVKCPQKWQTEKIILIGTDRVGTDRTSKTSPYTYTPQVFYGYGKGCSLGILKSFLGGGRNQWHDGVTFEHLLKLPRLKQQALT